MRGLLMLAMLTVLLGSSPIDGQTETHVAETTLRSNLQSGYDQYVRPYTPTYIDIVYILRSIQSLSVAEQKLVHSGYAMLTWHDPRLTWTPSSNGNIEELDINWVWRPQFFIFNGVDSADMQGADNGETRIIVYSNGTVTWQQFLVTQTSCDVDIELFPYDKQSCDVILMFSGYEEGVTVAFNLTSSTLNMMYYLENAEWLVTSTSMMPMSATVCCPQNKMPFVVLTMNAQRLHTFYVNTFMIPTLLISVCLVWPFYLPTDSGERIGFTLTVFLTYTVLLSITSTFLPTTSKQIPKLALYLLIVLFMCTLAVCNVTLHVKVYFLETPIPADVRKFYRIMKPIAFLEMKKKKSKTNVEPLPGKNVVTIEEEQDADAEPVKRRPPSTEPGRESPNTSPNDDEELTWKKVSELMDRICLIIYSIGVFLVDMIFMIYMAAA